RQATLPIRQAAGSAPNGAGTPGPDARGDHQHAAAVRCGGRGAGSWSAQGHPGFAAEVPQHPCGPPGGGYSQGYARRQRHSAGESCDSPFRGHRGFAYLRGHRIGPSPDSWQGPDRFQRLPLISRSTIRVIVRSCPTEHRQGVLMPNLVDFKDGSTQGLESPPVSDALAGLRANEARYLKNKFNHDFAVDQAGDATQTIDWVHQILAEERDLHIASKDRKSTRLNSSHVKISYAVFCLKKK